MHCIIEAHFCYLLCISSHEPGSVSAKITTVAQSQMTKTKIFDEVPRSIFLKKTFTLSILVGKTIIPVRSVCCTSKLYLVVSCCSSCLKSVFPQVVPPLSNCHIIHFLCTEIKVKTSLFQKGYSDFVFKNWTK